MPATRDYLTQRMPIRGKIAIAALYSEPFWRAAGTAMAESPRLVVWDEGGDELPALLTGLVSMAWSRHLSQLDDARREREIAAELARILGPAPTAPTELHAIYWAAEPWSRGCNSVSHDWRVDRRRAGLTPAVRRIHWACAENSPHFVGQMDGAVRSTESAVDAVCEALGANA